MKYNANNVRITVGGEEIEAWDVPEYVIEVVRKNGLDVNLSIPVDSVTINGETWVRSQEST